LLGRVQHLVQQVADLKQAEEHRSGCTEIGGHEEAEEGRVEWRRCQRRRGQALRRLSVKGKREGRAGHAMMRRWSKISKDMDRVAGQVL